MMTDLTMTEKEISTALQHGAEFVEEDRLNGNSSFRDGFYENALHHYTNCINGCLDVLQNMSDKCSGIQWAPLDKRNFSNVKMNLQLAQSNRSETFLRQGMFEEALKDAEAALGYGARDVKSLNRRGKALECLYRYKEAHDSFLEASLLLPNDRKMAESVRRTFSCFRQSENGEAFDPSDFLLNGGQGLDPFCEYVGPVEIQLISRNCRGLVLTEGVKAGRTLIASRAIARAHASQTDWGERNPAEILTLKLYNMASTAWRTRHRLGALQDSFYTIGNTTDPAVSEWDGPTVTEGLETLAISASIVQGGCQQWKEVDVQGNASHGQERADHNTETKPSSNVRKLTTRVFDSPSFELGVPSMDLFAPRPGSKSGENNFEVDDWEVPSDLFISDRILQIAAINGFDLHGQHAALGEEFQRSVCPGLRTSIDQQECKGLWLLPSFLNHSCAPNCAAVIIGDAMVVRSTKDIAMGEELTIAYYNILRPLICRQKSATKDPWSFWCNCPRCSFEKSITPKLQKLMSVYKKYADSTSVMEAFDVASLMENNAVDLRDRFLAATGVTPRAFIKELEIIIQNFDLTQKRWIRGSFIDAYSAQVQVVLGSTSSSRPVQMKVQMLMTVVETVIEIDPGNANGLKYFSRLLRVVGHYSHVGSKPFHHAQNKLLDILRIVYGIENRSAGIKIITKLQNMKD